MAALARRQRVPRARGVALELRHWPDNHLRQRNWGLCRDWGYLGVLDQPFEFLIICGGSIGIFIVANPPPTIKDTGKAIFEAITDQTPSRRDYLDLLNALTR